MNDELTTSVQQLTGKTVRRLRKRELMELVQSQNQQLTALQEKMAQMQEQLDRKEIIISESGSLAEASLRLHGVFEAAQMACDQYAENAAESARRLKADMEKECASMREEAVRECTSLREKTWKDCVDLREKTRQDCADLREKILLACEKQLREITVMPDVGGMQPMRDTAVSGIGTDPFSEQTAALSFGNSSEAKDGGE